MLQFYGNGQDGLRVSVPGTAQWSHRILPGVEIPPSGPLLMSQEDMNMVIAAESTCVVYGSNLAAGSLVLAHKVLNPIPLALPFLKGYHGFVLQLPKFTRRIYFLCKNMVLKRKVSSISIHYSSSSVFPPAEVLLSQTGQCDSENGPSQD
jgi:hypothetical protein